MGSVNEDQAPGAEHGHDDDAPGDHQACLPHEAKDTTVCYAAPHVGLSTGRPGRVAARQPMHRAVVVRLKAKSR